MSQSGKYRVHAADQKIGSESAADTHERSSKTGDRMPSQRMKHHRAKRNKYDIARFGSEMTEHARCNQRHRDQPLRSPEYERTNERSDQTGALSHTDSDHGDQHEAKRREGDEILFDVFEHPPNSFGGKQAAHSNDFPGPGVNSAQIDCGGNARKNDDQDGKDGKDRSGMRQSVPDDFNGIEGASEK